MSNPMTPERWREVTQIYGAVVSQAPERRAAAVVELCGADEDLRREIESLLESKDGASLLGRAAVDRGSVMQMLAIGSQIGVFRIDSLLGVGGMGEVYRARDTKLNRDVAIKILPPAFANDPDRLARFKREAQVLASLNHPNVGGIYGFEDANGIHALVLELVEGPTLAELLASGSGARASGRAGLPIGEALAMARQIADALEAAHEQGIIHRDLKPANIKIRDDGTVKVLDFGLAKLAEGPAKAGHYDGPTLTQSPTITTPAMTAAGMILGTAAYMSPEQAKGRPADKRSDIWAFGCVLYEMLTGKRAFDGEDVTETLAAIIKDTPDWSVLPGNASSTLARLLRQCLEKDRRNRVADISTVRYVLNEPRPDQVPATAPSTQRQPATRWMIAVAALLITGSIIGAAWMTRPSIPPGKAITRFVIPAPRGLRSSGSHVVAISPDGENVVFADPNQQLYLRQMSDNAVRPIAGTAEVSDTPFFSPDGQWLAYYSASERKFRKVPISGGAAISTICDVADPPFGASWGSDDEIYFAQPRQGGIFRVSSNGGTPQRVVEVKTGEYAHGPQLLPGGDAVLFTLSIGRGPAYWDRAQIVVRSLKTGKRTIVIEGGSDARWVPTGHLVYALGSTILAAPFDLNTLHVTGVSVPVVESVRRTFGLLASGAAQFSVANNGTLVYVPGANGGDMRVVMVDRSGRQTPLNIPAGAYAHARLSPDGTQLALFKSDDKGQEDIAIYDMNGTTPLRSLTFEGLSTRPIWTPDGQRIVFTSARESDSGLFSQRADGSAGAERLARGESGASLQPEAWSKDGALILSSSIGGQRQLMMLKTLKSGTALTPSPLVPVWASNASLSADGRWMAYMGGRLGDITDIWVRQYPPTDAKSQVTTGGAADPVWSLDGKQLFYVVNKNTPTSQLMVVDVQTEPTFKILGRPTPLPITGFIGTGPRNWDISHDGQSFIVIVPDDSKANATSPAQINVTLNWFEELKQRVSVKR